MSARMKPVNSAAGGSVEGQSLYGFRHFEPRFFQEGPQSRCGQMWFGKNLLNEHKFQAVSFFFFQHESERMCFTKLCQQWQWLSFLEKTTFRKIRRVIFVKGNPRRKSTYAKGCPFSSPPKNRISKVFVLWTVDPFLCWIYLNRWNPNSFRCPVVSRFPK